MVHRRLSLARSCIPFEGRITLFISSISSEYSFQVFPDNEVKKGQLTMQLKRLRDTQEGLAWPQEPTDLPVISWQSCEPVSKPDTGLELIDVLQSRNNRRSAH